MNKKRSQEMRDFSLRIGGRLRALRKSRGVYQHDIAEYLGVDRTAIIYHENGKNAVHTYYLLKLCQYYGISIETLLTAEDDDFAAYLEQTKNHAAPQSTDA